MSKRFVLFSSLFVLILAAVSFSEAGVRQMRKADLSSNVGTNAYSDAPAGGYTAADPADSNQGGDYATVNPNYQDYPTGGVVTGGYYYDYGGYAAAVPAGAQIPIGTILEYAPSRAVPLMVQGQRYYYADNVFLAEVYDGYAVVYQVVPAPLARVYHLQLREGREAQYWSGFSRVSGV
jgi:hypothetical protein